MFRKKSASSILNQHLGESELAVLECLWRQTDQDAKSVLGHLQGQQGRVSLSTVQSTLERLAKKNLLQREKRGHAFVYRAAVSRSELLARMMGDVIHLLHDGSLDAILSSFVSVAERLDDDSLVRLQRLIDARKTRQANPSGEDRHD